ncbi:MAG: hypothetical protein P9L97_06200 [Candidatus Tenebribacter davisii]|nr:hypothetical protein [Candidatus Tenebribacter davisii]
MRTEKLTYKELLRQLDYNSLTGIFIRKISNSSRVKIGDIAGSKNKKGYIQICVNGKLYLAHRLAYFHYHGYMPENQIDHEDQIKHHNWILNLREASDQCQQRNQGTPKNNTSGVKGVVWNKNRSKWIAQITLNFKNKGLGYYKDFNNAVCARLAGEQCLNWEGCDSSSPAYQYVKENIQCQRN